MLFSSSITLPPPRSTLFPYTTLFRSDTGAMLLKWDTEIGPEENALELGDRMAHAGADLLVETLARIETGSIQPERSEEHTSELQSHSDLVCRLLLEKKNAAVEITSTA